MLRLFDRVETLLDWLSAALVMVCLAAVSIQVVMRYVFGDATTWSDTVAASSLAWMTFLAATAAVRRDDNLSVRFLWAKLGPGSRKIVATLCHLVVLFFALVLTYSGAMLMEITRTAQVEGIMFSVTWAQFYSISVISGVLMVLFTLESIASLWLRGVRS
jgi:TRAP-type C4-dicarboxylate transport system permease small subunit